MNRHPPNTTPRDTIYDHVSFLYGNRVTGRITERIEHLLHEFAVHNPQLESPLPQRVTERDAILITYGDTLQQEGSSPLRTLADFCRVHLVGAVSGLHILPFFPFSSDDGFSVVDYKAVNPELGSWDDIAHIGQHFRLMFDAVINHVSAKSMWFQSFLRSDAHYRDYFISVKEESGLTDVFRPRSSPLLTQVNTSTGLQQVWTTFSKDQIDLNYTNPEVLVEIVKVILHYVKHSAHFLRLDAIAYLWKESGTSSLHLPQTHRIVQILRSVLDKVAPHVSLITETNVPHKDNISYFGNGINEAQLVYNFALPPLVLHTFHTQNANVLSDWAKNLSLPSTEATYLNFLASHDGIGMTPAHGLLSDTQISEMAQRTEALGGNVSTRRQPDGSDIIYELNINYLDALSDPETPQQDRQLVALRFLSSQAIMLALRGVPAIYIHSLLGSSGWPEGVSQHTNYRAINREKLHRKALDHELSNPNSLRHKVFYRYLCLLKQRTSANRTAFHPNGDQLIMELHPAVFAVLRSSPDHHDHVFCLHNVSAQKLPISLDTSNLPPPLTNSLTDITSGTVYPVDDTRKLRITLAPYQFLWLSHPS